MEPQITQIDADSRDEQTHTIIAVAMDVHGELSPGYRIHAVCLLF